MNLLNKIKLDNYKPISEVIKKYYRGRRILTWGVDESLNGFLALDGMKPEFYLTVNSKKVNGNITRMLGDIKNKASEYYIVVPGLEKRKFKQELTALGYNDFEDFIFINHGAVVIPAGSGEYSDRYGNYVKCRNCTVTIGNDVFNSRVDVDDTVTFAKNCRIQAKGSNVTVSVDRDCRFREDIDIHMYSNSSLKIGSQTTVGSRTNLSCCSFEAINIGKDCMLSYDIRVVAGDGHSIFDVETGKRTNLPNVNKTSATIEIKDHVWVGMRVCVLSNTTVGRSCVVAAGAVVKGEFPNNCIIAGLPAKAVKKNISWCRNGMVEDISYCGEENIHMTEE